MNILNSLKQFFRNEFLSLDKRIDLYKRGKKYIKFKNKDYLNIQKKYLLIKEKIKKNIKANKKIRVGFIVNLASSFAARPVFEKMLNDDIFEPSIIVVPFASEGSEDFRISTYQTSLKQLSEKYQKVLAGYDVDKKEMIDYTDTIDIAFLPTSAECDIPSPYNIFDLIKKGILTYYCSYAWQMTNLCRDKKYGEYDNFGLNLIYTIFSETQFNIDDFVKFQPTQDYNRVVAGYVKMDKLASIEKRNSLRKRIIIAPHHSIHGIGLCSQFLKYANYIQELPNLYPDIDFIFRPHPCLLSTLKTQQYWGEEKTENYMNKLLSNKNIIFDNEDEYFDLFINSDGIIHDCGSFLPEYLMTENPPCYVLRDETAKEEYFNALGKACVEHCYQAFSNADIKKYIENVVLKGNDTMKDKRIEFVNNNLKVNYPNVASYIINYIKEELS